MPSRPPGLNILALGSVIAAAGWFWLQRDPVRHPPDDADAILAPADGKVLLSECESSPGWVEEPTWRIAIYLSLLDVHIQRSPISARAALSQSHPGGHYSANKPQAIHNSGHSLGLESQHGRILVIRRAGIIARRVITTAHEGEILSAGQRIGRILLGSRTEVYLPGTVNILVHVGEIVRAGETILARWKD